MAQVCRAEGDERPPVVVGLGGERHLVERGLDHWRGWRASRPVRVGNAAWEQFQLDITGEVWSAVDLLAHREATFDAEEVSFFVDLADMAATRWQEPDAGIWEAREGARHYTTSKVMCWAALDRACRLAVPLGISGRVDRWERARDAIHRSVMTEAWDDRRKTFTGAYGSDHLDASTLLMPLVGFLPAHHPRIRKTVDAIEHSLSDHGLVHRWTDAEDEPFVMCSFWLAECHAMAGHIDRAVEVFEQVAGHANDVGLLAEEVAASSGALIGNFPQGLSHAALVNAADTINRALGSRRRRR
jgi:GH15 family glucan-1,4-alpha-glucosidase